MFTRHRSDQPTVCIVRRDRTLWCWGRNLRGELARGRGNRTASKWPVQAVGEPGQDAGHILSVEVGGAGVCAIRDDGTAVAAIERLWFDDSHYYDACVPATDVTCSIYEGDIWCRGEDSFGLLGGGEVTPEGARVAEVEDAVQLSISASHACALTQDGHVWCWGSNVYGEVGRVPLTAGNSYGRPPVQDPEAQERWLSPVRRYVGAGKIVQIRRPEAADVEKRTAAAGRL